MTATLPSVDASLAHTLARYDRDALRRQFQEQDEFLLLEGFLPDALHTAVMERMDAIRPQVHRNFVPKVKKGGSVSRYTLDTACPIIPTLYRSPLLRDFLQGLTGAPLLECPPADPHAYALYFYTEPGDYIGWHFDTSYYRGKRYTLLFGLINQSKATLDCQLYRTRKDRPPVDHSVALHPGMFVFFNGDTVWHQVTPLGAQEERVSLTMEFVTDPRMHPWSRFVSNMKDSIAYFGFRQVFRRKNGR